MSPTRPRTRRPEDRRDELLDAAERIFVEKGVAATTVSEIASAAGVAKGTFYLYFDSKDHLVAGLHERLSAGMERIAQDSLAGLDGSDLLELADEIVAAIIDYWIDHRALYVQIAQAGDTRETAEILTACDERIIAMLEAGIRVGVETGQFAVDSPSHAARFMFYGCHGTTHAALFADGPVDRDGLVTASQHLIRKLVAH